MPNNEIQREEVLIGLSMLGQMFAQTFDRELAVEVQRLYQGDEQTLLKAMLTAATLCLQRYATDTDVPELQIIEDLRTGILTGETLLG